MKYSLRSLVLVTLMGPPLLAGGWLAWTAMFPPLERVDNCDHFVLTLEEFKAAVKEYQDNHP